MQIRRGHSLLLFALITVSIVALVALALFAVGWGENAVEPVQPSAGGSIGPETAGNTGDERRVPVEGPMPIGPPAKKSEDNHGSLIVSVRYEDGSIGEQIGLIAYRHRGEKIIGLMRTKTNSLGVAEFTRLPAGRVVIEPDRALATREQGYADISAGKTTEMTIVIPVALTIYGRVVDWQNQPVTGAEIWLAPLATSYADTQPVARSGTGGAFSIKSGHLPSLLGARARDYAPSPLTFVDQNVGYGADELVLTLPDRGGNVTGMVRDRGGRPIAGAVVRVGAGRMDNVVPLAGSSPALPCQVTTDANGRFLAEGIPAGTQQVTARASETAPWSGACSILKSQTTTLDIVLGEGATVVGRVTIESGQGAEAARIIVGVEGMVDCSYASTDHQGDYRLEGLREGRQEIVAKHPQFGSAKTEVELSAGETKAVDFGLSRGMTMRGTLITDEGDPVVGARIKIWDGPDVVAPAGRPKTEPGGRWSMGGLRSREIRLRADHPSIEAVLCAKVDPTKGDVSLVAQAKWKRKDRVSVMGQLTDADGHPLARAKVMLAGETYSPDEARTDHDGGFHIRAFPGNYQMRYSAKDHALLISERFALEPGTQKDFGVIKIPRGGWIEIGPERQLPAGTYAGVCFGEQVAGTLWKETHFRSPLLAPGLYTVYVRGPGIATSATAVKVSEGEVSRLNIETVRGQQQAFAIDISPELRGDKLDVAITPAGGEPLPRAIQIDGDTTIRFSEMLGVGRYTMEASIDKTTRAVAFEVAEAGTTELRLRLP